MNVDVKPLEHAEAGETLEYEFTTTTPKLPDLTATDLRTNGTISQLGDRLLVTGSVETDLKLVCARCTKPFVGPVKTTYADEYAQRPSDEQLLYVANDLDLRPAVRTALLLAVPSRPLHDPACKGLCPVCGKDLNQEPHAHEPVKDDHPFAVLKKLRK